MRGHMDYIATEREKLYRFRHPEGLQVPIMLTPVAVDNGVLEESELERAVRCLKGGRPGGPSGIQAEDLNGWLR